MYSYEINHFLKTKNKSENKSGKNYVLLTKDFVSWTCLADSE